MIYTVRPKPETPSRSGRRQGCYKEGAKTKTYSVRIKSDKHKHQMDYQETDEFRAKSRSRHKIEAKNAELKNVFRYDRALSYGLTCMQLQGVMAILLQILTPSKNKTHGKDKH
jgi:hypothetical protein